MPSSEHKGAAVHGRRGAVLALLFLATRLLAGQELLTGTLPERTMASSEALQRIVISPDGSTALLLQQGNTLRTVALATGRTLRTFGPLPGKITALALEGRAGFALVASEREVWSASVDQEDAPRRLWATEGSIQDLSLSPDLDLLAVATTKGLHILNPRTGNPVWSAPGSPCTAIRFAPVGNTVVLALGKTLEVREVPGFALKQTWSFDFPISALAYAPDARSLAVGGRNGRLLLKRVADGQTLKQLDPDLSGREVTLLTFASDPSGLLVASGRTLQAFSGLERSTPASRTLTVDEPILSLAFSRDSGALLAVTEGGRALARWPVAVPPRLAARPREDLPVLTILSPEPGSKVASGVVELSFQVTFPPERPVTRIRILAGGRPAHITFTPTPGAASTPSEGAIGASFLSGRRYTCRVQLPDRDTTLLLQADSPGGSSEPALLTLQRSSKAPQDLKVTPPTVTLLSPAGKAVLQSPSLLVSFRIGSPPGQPVTLVRALLDGVPVPFRNITRSSGAPFDSALGWVNGETYRCRIEVPGWDSTLMLVADTDHASSAPAVAKLQWKNQPTPNSKSPAPAHAGLLPGEAPLAGASVGTDFGKVRAGEQTTRILEGSPQGAAGAMEVDAKGRLRWRDPAADSARKATPRNPGAAPTATATRPAQPGLPSVQILAPGDGSRFKGPEVQLSVKIGGTTGTEVTRLQVFVDGAPVEVVTQSPAGTALTPPYPVSQVLKLSLPLPPRDCQVSVQPEGTAGPGKPSLLRLKFEGASTPAVATRGSVVQAAKPRISILEPQHNAFIRTNVVQLGVRVTGDPKNPPPAIRILVDAQEVKAEKVAPPGPPPEATPGAGTRGPAEETQYFSLTLPSKDCTVMAYAETPYATSDPSLVKLRWETPAKASTAASAGPPTLYLLAVGVSNYKDKNITLTYPSKDAKDFAEAMSLQKGKLYRDVVVRVRTDEQATRDNIMDDLEWIQRQATQRDMVIVFLAGHGINDAVTGNYYYLPYDASIEAVKRTMIPGSEIHSTLARLTGTRILFMDTCHAGNVTGTAMRGVPDLRQFLQDLKDGGQGLVVITSSRPGQKSQEHPAWNNGAFTKALVEGLKGKAQKDRQGFITFTALDAYITQRVKELTKGTQAPATQKSTEVSDFPLAFSEL